MPLSSEAVRIRKDVLAGNRQERERAIEQLQGLEQSDCDQLADDLIHGIDAGLDVWPHAWSLSALGKIGRPEDLNVFTSALTDKTLDPWVRYWAAIGLVEHSGADALETLAKGVFKESEALVRSIRLRLLLELAPEEPEVQKWLDGLLDMLTDDFWDHRWVAAKALRSYGVRSPLPDWAQTQSVPVLTKLLSGDRSSDVKTQAAWALGSMAAEWELAIEALGTLLGDPEERWEVRRACLDALQELGKRESADVIASALVGPDAEIRIRAAGVLVDLLGEVEAVELIAGRLVDHDLTGSDDPVFDLYLQALRNTNIERAGVEITRYANHPDPKVADRATTALQFLGGESAFAALHNQKREMLEHYTALLSEADQRTTQRFHELMTEARGAFVTSMWMHRIVFAIGVLALAAGLIIALVSGLEDFTRFVGAGTAVGATGLLLALFYRDPLRNIQRSLIGLLQVTVVFQGFVRQINQIDATFKQKFLIVRSSSDDSLKPSLDALRSSVGVALDEIDAHLRLDDQAQAADALAQVSGQDASNTQLAEPELVQPMGAHG